MTDQSPVHRSRRTLPPIVAAAAAPVQLLFCDLSSDPIVCARPGPQEALNVYTHVAMEDLANDLEAMAPVLAESTAKPVEQSAPGPALTVPAPSSRRGAC